MGGEGRSRVWLGYGVIFFFLKNPSLKNKIFFFFFLGGGGGGEVREDWLVYVNLFYKEF